MAASWVKVKNVPASTRGERAGLALSLSRLGGLLGPALRLRRGLLLAFMPPRLTSTGGPGSRDRASRPVLAVREPLPRCEAQADGEAPSIGGLQRAVPTARSARGAPLLARRHVAEGVTVTRLPRGSRASMI